MTAFNPDYELLGEVVDRLRGDAALGALLFGQRPRIEAEDHRVWQEGADLPPGELREVLPRVYVGTAEYPFDTEQDGSALPLARASVFIHVLADAGQRQLGERIAARSRVILGSQPFGGSRISASGLYLVAAPPPQREPALRNAWRLTREYRSGLVGVTADG